MGTAKFASDNSGGRLKGWKVLDFKKWGARAYSSLIEVYFYVRHGTVRYITVHRGALRCVAPD